jgi:DNA-binding NtrC family response regulator
MSSIDLGRAAVSLGAGFEVARAVITTEPGEATASPGRANVLLVEDDAYDRLAFQRCVSLGSWSCYWTVATSVAEARELMRGRSFDVVVCAAKLRDGTGADVSALTTPGVSFVLTTPRGRDFYPVQAKLRASGQVRVLRKDDGRHYLDELPTLLAQILDERVRARAEASARHALDDILVGASLGQVKELIELAATSGSPVLVTGETGVGKNRIAQAIHDRGPSAASPFLTLTCAALPEQLIEGELFGYERGAFTGAISTRRGMFEIAEGGTLLLDELGDMPFHLQSKLLGVLDDQSVRRIGSETVRRIRTRVIAATSLVLEAALGKTFRSDLYFRLSVIRIDVPPLRQRAADIPSLVAHLLARLAPGRQLGLARSESDSLCRYPWPGNVRELKNVLERALIVSQGGELRPSLLLSGNRGDATPALGVPALTDERILTLDEVEADHIHKTMARLGGNITQTARALGISISTLKRKLRAPVA